MTSSSRDDHGSRGPRSTRTPRPPPCPAPSLTSLTVDGHLALVGSVTGDWPPLDPRLLFAGAATVRALAVGSRAQFLAMNDLITARRLRPVPDRTFPFNEAVAAYRYYESARPFGKVVIEIGP
ncbi:zinc-binding dehydrogenase [Streptomyces sp. NPDC002530]